jgi:hypothetical protein
MLDYILNTAQTFEREHGTAPDVIYINPLHYEQVTRYCPDLFAPGSKLHLGFRLVIVPATVLAHPQAALLTTRPAADTGSDQVGNDVAGWR